MLLVALNQQGENSRSTGAPKSVWQAAGEGCGGPASSPSNKGDTALQKARGSAADTDGGLTQQTPPPPLPRHHPPQGSCVLMVFPQLSRPLGVAPRSPLTSRLDVL